MPNTGSAMVTTLVPVAARETSAETRRILADAGAPFCGVFLALADGIAAVARSATARPVTTALFLGELPDAAIAVRHVAVRCAVEPVTPDAVPRVQMIRQRVEIRVSGKRSVKRRIEHGHLR